METRAAELVQELAAVTSDRDAVTADVAALKAIETELLAEVCVRGSLMLICLFGGVSSVFMNRQQTCVRRCLDYRLAGLNTGKGALISLASNVRC